MVITSRGVVITGSYAERWSRDGALKWLEIYNKRRACGSSMPLLDLFSGVFDWLVGLPALLAGLYVVVSVLKPILLLAFGLAMFLLIE